MAPFLWTASCCWGGCLVLLRGCDACRTVGVDLQSEASLIDVRLDVGSLLSRSSSPTVKGCRLGGFSVGRDWWGGDLVVGGVVPRINIDTWGLCDRLCLVLVCRGRYCLGCVSGGSSLHSGIEVFRVLCILVFWELYPVCTIHWINKLYPNPATA